MAKKIQGITVEIGGNTTGLNKALSDTNKNINTTQKELKEVNKALKLDPTNTKMLAQKQQLLGDQISNTKDKLSALKQAKKTADREMKEGTEYNEQEYRELQREISNTQSYLSRLQKQSHDVGNGVLMDISAAAERVSDVTGKAADKLMPVSAALAGLGIAGGKMAMDFEDSMANINTLLDDTKNLQTYENAVKDLSNETGMDLDLMTDGMYQAISSLGDGGQETVGIFGTMAKSAKAGGAEVKDSVALISAGMKGYNRVNDKTAQKISDLAFQTAKLGVTTFPEMAKSMQPLFPLANSLNLSYEELFGSMATLTGVTGNTAEVSTQLKAIFSSLMKPTTDMQALIEKYGFSNAQAMLESKGLTGVLEILREETGGQADKLGSLLGSTEAITAATALTGSQFDVFKDKLQAMGDATGATKTAYKKMETSGDDTRKTVNLLKNTLLELGEALLDIVGPVLKDVSKWMKNAADKVRNMTDEEKKNIVKTAAFVAALAPALKLISGLTSGVSKFAKGLSGISGLLGPTGRAVVGVATGVTALGTALYMLATKDSRAAQENLEKLKSTASESKETFHEYAQSMQEAEQQTYLNMNAADQEAGRIQNLWSELQTLVDANGNVISSDEDRVNYILGELNGALGTQLEYEDGHVKSYQEQCDLMDKLVEKKKAQMQLAAYEAEYQNALEIQNNSRKEQIELSGQIAEQQMKVNDAYQAYLDSPASSDKYSAWQKEKDGLKELQQQYNENAGMIEVVNDKIKSYTEANLAFEEEHYEQIEELLSKQALAYTVAGSATKESLGQQAKEMTNTMIELRKGLKEGQEGITEDMVKNAEDLAVKATQEYQKVGGKAGEGYIIGFDNNGAPIYKAAADLNAKAVEGVKSNRKELKATLELLGIDATDGLISALTSKSGEVQQETIRLLSKMSEGSYLSADEIKTVFANLGIEAPETLVSSLMGVTPDVYTAAVALLSKLKTATGDERQGILDQLFLLGVNMDDFLYSGLDDNKDKPINKSGSIGHTANSTMGSALTEKNLQSPNVDGSNTLDSALSATKAAREAAQDYLNNHAVSLAVKTVVNGAGTVVDIAESALRKAGFYADGGKITKPTFAVMGENGKEEYVIPVSPGKRARGTELLLQAAQDLNMPIMDYAMNTPNRARSNNQTGGIKKSSQPRPIYLNIERLICQGGNQQELKESARQVARELYKELVRKERADG